MKPRIQPDAPSSSLKHAKRILWGLAIIAVLGLASYFLAPLYIFYYVPEELPPYDIPPRVKDDTLRIAIIGDSWAEFHMNLQGDTIFDIISKRIYDKPLKSRTRGKGYATSKDIYFYMFDYMTTEHSYEPDRCTQPLIEEHPDYCVIYAGINDAILRRPTYYYTGSIRSIIRLLLHNDIRPVVMEMPKFSHPGSFNWRPLKERAFILVRGLLMGTWYNDVSQYRMALKDMLTETGLQDSILYIPTTKWNPKGCEDAAIYIEDQVHLNLDGYHILDSCLISEITKDYSLRNHNTSK